MADENQNDQPKKQSPFDRLKAIKRPPLTRKQLITLGIVAGIVILSLLVFEYIQTKKELNKAKDPQSAAQAEAENITRDIGKYLELPQNEKPTTATVTDKSKLQDQPFFQQAENGDKALVYAKSGKAILYRPSTKKIIVYAPVNLAAGGQQSGTSQGR